MALMFENNGFRLRDINRHGFSYVQPSDWFLTAQGDIRLVSRGSPAFKRLASVGTKEHTRPPTLDFKTNSFLLTPKVIFGRSTSKTFANLAFAGCLEPRELEGQWKLFRPDRVAI